MLVLIVSFKSIEPSSATVGTYQGFGADGHRYMINTITGELYTTAPSVRIREWKRKSPKTNWIVE